MHIDGVGFFRDRESRWEGYPEALGGASLSIESVEVLQGHQERCRYICGNWTSILLQCLAYIEAKRSLYALEAKQFSAPGVFVDSSDEWSVYFDTDHEVEAVVGVEFRRTEPFQLIIGD